MGCACAVGGITLESKGKANSGFPLCQETYPLTIDTDIVLPINEEKFLLGGKDEIQIFDLPTKKITTYSKEHKGRINCIIKLSNGNFATAGQDKLIKIWDLTKNESLMTLTGHTSMIWTINEIKNNKLISGSSDKTCKIWDLNEKKEEYELYKGNEEISVTIQLKNGKVLICCGKKLIQFNIENKKVEKSLNVPKGIWSIIELSNGDLVAGLGYGIIIIIGCENELKIKNTLSDGHTKSVSSLIELENGKVVSASDSENDMILWDLKNQSVKYIIQGHTNCIRSLAVISGNKFVSVSKDKSLKIWE